MGGQKGAARQRIEALFSQIRGMRPYSQVLADRYVKRAWQLHTKHKAAIPLALQRRFCRNCKSYWRQGCSVRMRIHQGKKIYTCLVCGRIKRVVLKRKSGKVK